MKDKDIKHYDGRYDHALFILTWRFCHIMVEADRHRKNGHEFMEYNWSLVVDFCEKYYV